MRTAAGIVTVLIIVILIYIFLPASTKKSVQFWKPDYSVAPSASASPTATPIADQTFAPAFTPTPTSGFVAVASGTARASAKPSASSTAQATGSATLAQGTRLPGTGDFARDPILLALTFFATTIAVATGYRMSKYR